jgi:hypothetical protein
MTDIPPAPDADTGARTQEAAATRSPLGIGLARSGITLLFLVIISNLALYELLFLLGQHGLLDNNSIFPQFILFLSLSLSVGILLVTGLGEKVSSKEIDGGLLKGIGVTPTLVIVAAMISLILAFANTKLPSLINTDPLANKLVLAEISLTCSAKLGPDAPPAGSDLILVIWSPDDGYIKEISDTLSSKDLKKHVRRSEQPDIHLIKGAGDENKGQSEEKEYMELLRSQGGEAINRYANQPNQWIAYRVPVQASAPTLLPIPTIYEKWHETRLFVVMKRQFGGTQVADNTNTKEQLALPNLAGSTRRKLSLQEVFHANFKPLKPKDDSFLTQLVLDLSPDNRCWRSDS